MSTTLVRNINYFGQTGDLLLKDSLLEAFFPGGSDNSADVVIAGNNCMAIPSLIDAHVHFREPGHEYKEEISTGLKAAIGGGFGHVLNMANTSPVNDNAAVTRFMLDKSLGSCPKGPRLHPVGALTKNLAGQELAPMAELADAGCVAFSNDGQPVSDAAVFRRAVEYAADLRRLVIDHCEDPALSADSCMNEGRVSSQLGLPGSPTVAESLQVARDILLAQYLEIPIHLAHISCRQSVELIDWAKRKSIPVSAETCPHYLFLEQEAIGDYNTLAKVNPPLRTEDDILALRQAVRTGTIDIITSDHAPHADFEKDQPFSSAPFGISGLDTSFSLIFSLCNDDFSLQDILRLCLRRPAEIYNLEYSTLEIGQPADFFIFDPAKRWLVAPESMLSRGKNSPWLGQELTGRVLYHFIGGELVFSRE